MDETTIVRVMTQLGCKRVEPRGSYVSVSCPMARRFHDKGRDEHPSASVLVNDDGESYFHCFTCGIKGSLTYLVKMVDVDSGGDFRSLYSFVESREQGDRHARMERIIARNEEPHVRPRRPRLEDIDVWDDSFAKKYMIGFPRYLLSRGVTLEVGKLFEIGYDRKQQRAVFPVRRFGDKALVGLTGRHVAGGYPPYKDYWGYKKGFFFYGEHFLEVGGKIILVEGPIDLLRLWTLGFRNVLALSGATLTPQRAERLEDWGLPLYVALDSGKAGRIGRQTVFALLRKRLRVYDVSLGSRKDPGEFESEEEFQACLDGAKFIR